MWNFSEIFREYYTLYRGQATSIPAAGSAEWLIGVQLANNAIRKWDRSDANEWEELKVNWADDNTTLISSATHTYSLANIRKKPNKILFRNAVSGAIIATYDVIDLADVDSYTDLNGKAYFTGGANRGYTLHLDGDLTTVNGAELDFRYIKHPTFFSTTEDGTTEPDMSDPAFIIHDMVCSRASNSRNGFLYNTNRADRDTALQNMKIENNAKRNLIKGDQVGWGVQESLNDGLGRL